MGKNKYNSLSSLLQISPPCARDFGAVLGSLGTPLHHYTESVILSGDDFASSSGTFWLSQLSNAINVWWIEARMLLIPYSAVDSATVLLSGIIWSKMSVVLLLRNSGLWERNPVSPLPGPPPALGTSWLINYSSFIALSPATQTFLLFAAFR